MEIEPFLAPVPGDDPCGPDLEYDPEFMELAELAKGKPERQVGSEVIPAEPPNWREVRKRAEALLAKSKDLRLAVLLCQSWMEGEGVEGLRDGVKLTGELLKNYWEGIHPRLDPDDDNDPTFRVNSLAALVGSEFLRGVREAPLCESRRGQFGLRALGAVLGEAPPQGEAAEGLPDFGSIEAAFADTAADTLQAREAALSEASEALEGIGQTLMERVGAYATLDFGPLESALKQMAKIVQTYLAKRGLGSAAPEEAAPGESEGAAPAAPSAPAAPPGTIQSPNDVLTAIDRICEYYDRCEPSSPVPLLLKRAKNLVSKNFLDIVRDLAQESVQQLENLAGIKPEDQSERRSR